MSAIPVDGFAFTFPESWTVTKYDDWKYYREKFVKVGDGIKGVDLIALDPEQQIQLWLIEVKDFRKGLREKDLPPGEEICSKVLDTLAALLPAAINANIDAEKEFARSALNASRINIVFFAEQPIKPSRLFRPIFNQQDLQKKLREKLRAIDPHLHVASSANMPPGIPYFP